MRTQRALLTILALVALVVACSREKEVSKKDCSAFLEWSKTLGTPLAKAVASTFSISGKTPAGKATINRKFAEGARETARTPIPFTDGYFKDLATRQLKGYEALAVAYDHAAEAWAKGDKVGTEKALREEASAQRGRQAITAEWSKKCGVP